MNKRTNIRFFFAILFFLFLYHPFHGVHKLLPPPKPTHTEKGVPCATLKITKEIQQDFDEDLFFAFPALITVGPKFGKNQFYLYVYDYKLIKIFIFNEKFEYIGQFLDHGVGPGEVDPGRPGIINFFAAPDHYLYVFSYGRISRFSATGKLIEDIKIPVEYRSMSQSIPVVDTKGSYYLYSTNQGIVDKYDQNVKRSQTYLDMKLNNRFIVYKPDFENFYKGKNSNLYHKPRRMNAIYDITSDGHLLIYLYRTSTVYLFKSGRLVRKFDVIVDKALELYMRKAKAAYYFQKSRPFPGIRAALMFDHCFVDKDEPYFYLAFNNENKTATVYKFDLKGKLVEIFNNLNAAVQAKRHGLYFGLGGIEKHPIIFKKEDYR